jgi:lipopolysaccharide transport system ATP-binding protein
MSVVRFQNVSKRFVIHHERHRSFQDLLVRGLRRHGADEDFWALRDISFEAEPGASLGVIGANGSGKSTLLKLATRILRPTSGRVAVDGRVSALLELGAGFHPELTGRENVFLNASILGMRRGEVESRYDNIVRFAGLEKFIDIPVKHYSSGMYARLGFAVAINVDPDVLLIDEVLSVGDEAFQERCQDAIYRLHRSGKTLLLVSHDVSSVANMCTEALWLDRGVVRAHGAPRAVIADYLAAARALADEQREVTEGLLPESSGPLDLPDRWGSGEAEIVGVELRSGGHAPGFVRSGEPLVVEVRFLAHQRIDVPVFGLGLTTADGVHLSGPNTRTSGCQLPWIEGRGAVRYVVDELPLMPGRYLVSASIYDQACAHPYDYHDRRYELTVGPGDSEERYGLVRLHARWDLGGLRAEESGGRNGRSGAVISAPPGSGQS